MSDDSTVPEGTEDESIEVTEAEPVGEVPTFVGFEPISNKLVLIGTEITEIDKELSAHNGVMAEIENRAKQHSRSVPVSSFFGGERTAFTLSADMTVGQYLDTLKAHLAESENFANMIGTAWLVENKPNGDKASALETRRETLVKDWGNLVGTLAQFDVDVSQFPTLPAAPSRRSVRNTVSNKGVRFYRMKNGAKSYYSGGSNSISILCQLIFGVGVDTLRERLRLDNNGNAVPESQPWHGTTTIGNKTVEWGWEIEEQA